MSRHYAFFAGRNVQVNTEIAAAASATSSCLPLSSSFPRVQTAAFLLSDAGVSPLDTPTLDDSSFTSNKVGCRRLQGRGDTPFFDSLQHTQFSCPATSCRAHGQDSLFLRRICQSKVLPSSADHKLSPRGRWRVCTRLALLSTSCPRPPACIPAGTRWTCFAWGRAVAEGNSSVGNRQAPVLHRPGRPLGFVANDKPLCFTTPTIWYKKLCQNVRWASLDRSGLNRP